MKTAKCSAFNYLIIVSTRRCEVGVTETASKRNWIQQCGMKSSPLGINIDITFETDPGLFICLVSCGNHTLPEHM